MDAETLRENVMASFHRVKDDIRMIGAEVAANKEEISAITGQLNVLGGALREINEALGKLLAKKAEAKPIVRNVKGSFIASKTGKNFHKESCISGQRISAKTKVEFKTVAQAKKAGYKKCGVCLG